MIAFTQANATASRLRRLGVWLGLVCLITGAAAVVVLDAPQILDQYTSGRE